MTPLPAAPATPAALRSPRATVVEARRLATQEWSRLLGDASACTLARDGRAHPAAKFFEGEVAALGELARQITDESAPSEVAHAASALRARWADTPMPGAPRSPDWEAYRAGRIQAMTDISAAVTPALSLDRTPETTP